MKEFEKNIIKHSKQITLGYLMIIIIFSYLIYLIVEDDKLFAYISLSMIILNLLLITILIIRKFSFQSFRIYNQFTMMAALNTIAIQLFIFAIIMFKINGINTKVLLLFLFLLKEAILLRLRVFSKKNNYKFYASLLSYHRSSYPFIDFAIVLPIDIIAFVLVRMIDINSILDFSLGNFVIYFFSTLVLVGSVHGYAFMKKFIVNNTKESIKDFI